MNAKAWEESPWVLRQLDQIGEKSVKRLAEHDIASIDDVRRTEASRIEIVRITSYLITQYIFVEMSDD